MIGITTVIRSPLIPNCFEWLLITSLYSSGRPVTRYAIQTVPQQSRWMTGNWTDREQAALALTSGTSANLRLVVIIIQCNLVIF